MPSIQTTGEPPETEVIALYNKVTLQDVAAPLEIFARPTTLARSAG